MRYFLKEKKRKEIHSSKEKLFDLPTFTATSEGTAKVFVLILRKAAASNSILKAQNFTIDAYCRTKSRISNSKYNECLSYENEIFELIKTINNNYYILEFILRLHNFIQILGISEE